uniref:toll-like receptor 12 n=1 Tax=Centroberyx gerrardi TaxID=166262 RepID=UPI003AAE7AF3
MCVSVLLLRSLCGGGVEALIRQFCDWFEEDEYVQKDIGGTIPCQHMPGLGPYTECADVTNLRLGLKEVFPDTRTLCICHSDPFLPHASFSHFPSLEMLKLDGGLAKVSTGAFSGLSKLRFLHINTYPTGAGCVNCTLELGAFQGLASLEELTLIGVCLSVVPQTLLFPLVGLRKLTVEQVGVRDLGEVFCLLIQEMKSLQTLELLNSQVATIRNRGCANRAGSDAWPTEVLSRIQDLALQGNPVQTVESGSLSVFQSLSSVGLSLQDTWVGQLWESGIGKVAEVYISSYIDDFSPTLDEMCTLVTKLGVQSLEMYKVHVRNFSTQALSRCGGGLRELSLSFAKPQGLELDFWTTTPGMQTLEMTWTQLSNASFCAAGRGAVWNLTSLLLPANYLTQINTDQFACMPLLEKLDLSNNYIAALVPRAFHGLARLRILKLAQNHLTHLRSHYFEELPALEVLDLDGNRIDIDGIEEGVLRKQCELRDLTLGPIDVIYELHLDLLFYDFPPKLQRFHINVGPGTNFNIGQLAPPEKPFVMEIIGDFVSLLDCDNHLFPKVRELTEQKGTFFICSQMFAAAYFPNLESFEFWADPERFTISYAPINQLRKLNRLKLVNLNFSNHSDPSVIFRNLTQLRSLVLINCRLYFLTKTMFADLVSLRLLRLYSENPLLLLDGVFLPLVHLSTVVFDHVDLRCDCSNGWLLEWAEHSPRVQVLSLQHQQCVWHYRRINFLSTMERLCQTDVDFLLYISTAIASSVLLCSSLGYRFLRWPFLILFFRARGWVERRLGRGWWRKRRAGRRGGEGIEEEELLEGEEVRYDAFVSFSSRDEAWVLGEMAPRLELEGEPQLRLCLHHRDFEVGKGIVDNIAESIYSSRKTVCVLSRRYLRSDWCSLELKVATHRLLSEHSHQLILIFLEHISPFELSAFHRLAKLASTRTYLDWPEDEGERVTFWERLRRNIAERE